MEAPAVSDPACAPGEEDGIGCTGCPVEQRSPAAPLPGSSSCDFVFSSPPGQE